jgi:hypothetical protein
MVCHIECTEKIICAYVAPVLEGGSSGYRSFFNIFPHISIENFFRPRMICAKAVSVKLSIGYFL